jgi:lipopolysaccharide export system protein LptA
VPALPSLPRCSRQAALRTGLAAALIAALCTSLPAAAEKADRYQKLKVEADQQGKFDLANNLVVFTGNVVVTRGTMVIQAARVELRETPGGYHDAVATGADGKPASFKQKREGVDETIEGQADRLEYSGRADTVKFVNRAIVKRLRNGTVADEISGQSISYNSSSEVFNVSGGASSSAAASDGSSAPGGRVRAVLTPREGSAAAAEAAANAANPPASAPLKLSPSLGEQPR